MWLIQYLYELKHIMSYQNDRKKNGVTSVSNKYSIPPSLVSP